MVWTGKTSARPTARTPRTTTRHASLSGGIGSSAGSCRPLLGKAVADTAHGPDQFRREWVVHLAAQVPNVDIDAVGQFLETLVPDVFDDHRARKHAPGIGRQVFR